MKINKGLNLVHSKLKAHLWRAVLMVAFIVTLGILNSGCCDDCDCEDEPTPADEYYVKYDVNSSSPYIQGTLNVTYKKEDNTNNTITIPKRQLWETIVGPAKKGFTATMQVDDANFPDSGLKLYTNIYVSKNNGPFVLKKTDGSDTPRYSVNISYTIDF